MGDVDRRSAGDREARLGDNDLLVALPFLLEGEMLRDPGDFLAAGE